MKHRSLRNRTQTAFHQARELLDAHYREYQQFHDGCSCDFDCDHEGIKDYDATLCFKKQEAYVASVIIDEIFDDDDSFRTEAYKNMTVEFLQYAAVYAGKHSPFLQQMFASIVVDIEGDDSLRWKDNILSMRKIH